MRASLCLLAPVLAGVLCGSCSVLDVRVQPARTEHNHAFIRGFVSAGWPEDDALLKAGLFDSPNHGSLLYVQLWKLLRVDIGIVGLAVGVGPLDAGLGLLAHHPRPPRYVGWDDDCDAGCTDACDDCGDCDEACAHGCSDCDDCEDCCEEEWDVDDDDAYGVTFRGPWHNHHMHVHGLSDTVPAPSGD